VIMKVLVFLMPVRKHIHRRNCCILRFWQARVFVTVTFLADVCYVADSLVGGQVIRCCPTPGISGSLCVLDFAKQRL
jgi:hypothetical protein